MSNIFYDTEQAGNGELVEKFLENGQHILSFNDLAKYVFSSTW